MIYTHVYQPCYIHFNILSENEPQQHFSAQISEEY